MSTFWSRRSMLKFSLLCHSSTHESLWIWNCPSLLTCLECGAAVLLKLQCLLYCLIRVEILVDVCVGSDGCVIYFYTIGSCILNRLVRSVSQALPLILRSICPSHTSACRVWIFLSLILSRSRSCIREIWIHFGPTVITMKSNILIGRTERPIVVIRNKITGSCWQNMDWIWI